MLIKELVDYCEKASNKTKNDTSFVSAQDVGFHPNPRKQKICAIIKSEKRLKCIVCRQNCKFQCQKCGGLCQNHALLHLS